MRLSSVIIVILIAGGIYSCIDPYTPDTFGYEEMLLIEGIIYDDPSMSPLVTISRSTPLSGEREIHYETGAIVSVECSDGTTYPFSETSPGLYGTSGIPVIPEPGKSYRLMVISTDQKVYASDYENYIPPSPIDSITYRTEYTKVTNLGEWEYGLRFYANSSGVDDTPVYLRWILDATFNYKVPHPAKVIWTGSSVEYYLGPDVRECWKDITIPGIFIGDSYGMEGNILADAKLNFVSQHGDELSIRYSLHVRQLSISKRAYEFWYDLRKVTDATGGLYETQPFRIRGNIECISDPDTEVCGVFEVAGVTESRIYADKPTEFAIITNNCEIEEIGTIELPWEYLPANTFIMEIDSVGIYGTTLAQQCFDCRLRGGTLIRPPFWE